MTHSYLIHTYWSEHEDRKQDRVYNPYVSSTVDGKFSKNKKFWKHLKWLTINRWVMNINLTKLGKIFKNSWLSYKVDACWWLLMKIF